MGQKQCQSRKCRHRLLAHNADVSVVRLLEQIFQKAQCLEDTEIVTLVADNL